MRTVELDWLVRINVPFSYSASKNHIWSNTARGHVFMRSESREWRDMTINRVQNALSDVRIKQNRLWIDIFVQKPDHRGDAVNFVDLICDAIKRAIPLDDRWYSLRRVDWEIVKGEPSIFIGIGQEIGVEDCQVCSYCGGIHTFEKFTKNRSTKSGYSRVCRECRGVERKNSTTADDAGVVRQGAGFPLAPIPAG